MTNEHAVAIATKCSVVKVQLDQLLIVPTTRITKKKRVEIDKTNLLVLSFIGKWLERHLDRFENEDRVSNHDASTIVHLVMDHVVIDDHAVGFKMDCEEDHDDL